MPAPLAPTTFRRRLLLAVVLPFLCMAILTALLLWQARRLINTYQSVDTTERIIDQAHVIEKTLIEMQNSARGFVISGMPEMLGPYESGAQRIESTVQSLQEMVDDNPAQRELVDAIALRINDWRRSAAEGIAMARAGMDLRERIRKGEGRRILDDALGKLNQFVEREFAVRNQLTTTMQRTTRIVISTAVGTMLTLSVILALISLTQLLNVGRTYAAALQTANDHADALRDSEERFRLMVDGVTDYALFLLDREGRIISWNRGAQRISDHPADDVIGKPLSIFLPSENDADAQAGNILQAAESAGRFEENGWRQRLDRSRFYAYSLVTALRDPAGQLRGFSYLMRDLTERKRFEDALGESEDRYRRLVEWSPDGMFIQCDGKFVYANPMLLKMLGAKLDDVQGKQVLDFIHPDYHEIVKERMRILTEEQREVPLIEEKLVRLDGSLISVELAATPYRYRGKAGAQVMVHDLTQRKSSEEEIRRLNAQLAKRIIELEEQLENSGSSDARR